MIKSNRTIITILLSISLIAGIINVTQGQPKSDKSDKPTGAYIIDKKASIISWKGSMVFASKGGHAGYVYFSEGKLTIEKGQLTSGSVEVDMNTIEDDSHSKDNGLIDHLKDIDFFEVKKFPVSTFAITRVAPGPGENIDVTGDLTIKGITHAVTFPAQVEFKDGILHANGKVTIDRTKWNVYYKSGKIFSNLADEAISDSIELEMKIVAKK
jgi:polyisoprenoid-binding protein YceI